MVDLEDIADKLSQVSEKGLSMVSSLAQQQINLEKRIADIEQELKAKKRELREVQEDLLPAALQEYNMTGYTMDDGSEISVKPFYSANISKDKSDEAFEWLTSNGHASLIKNNVSASFGRGQDNEAKSLLSELHDRGLETKSKTWVEPMTLKAFVKEQVEKGENLPYDLLGIFVGQRANIKRS